MVRDQLGPLHQELDAGVVAAQQRRRQAPLLAVGAQQIAVQQRAQLVVEALAAVDVDDGAVRVRRSGGARIVMTFVVTFDFWKKN